jgi:hypothetical protein
VVNIAKIDQHGKTSVNIVFFLKKLDKNWSKFRVTKHAWGASALRA